MFNEKITPKNTYYHHAIKINLLSPKNPPKSAKINLVCRRVFRIKLSYDYIKASEIWPQEITCWFRVTHYLKCRREQPTHVRMEGYQKVGKSAVSRVDELWHNSQKHINYARTPHMLLCECAICPVLFINDS